MAIIIGWIVVGSLIGLAVMQSTFVWIYCRFLKSSVQCEPNDSDQTKKRLPHVAVVLCLRGADPSLTDCLNGLFSLDYKSEAGTPNFEIHFVVDDKQDPALKVAHDFISGIGSQIKTQIHFLDPTDVVGSLKCTALVTAISTLGDSSDNSVEVVALADADVSVDPQWLSDLVAPLADPTVGVATGNRWFSPADNGLGSLVRQTWNAAAVAQMSFYQIPWGGSLALRLETIHDCGLLEKWSKAFCEDTMLKSVLREYNLKVVRVPSLILSSDESIRFRDAFRWITRQLLTVRLYHRDWLMVLGHGLLVGFGLFGTVAGAVWLFTQHQWIMGSIVAGVLVLFQALNLFLLQRIASANEAHINLRAPNKKMSKRALGQTLIAAIVTQLVQPLAAMSAAVKQKVSWRGVDYKIGAKKSISLVRYVPYREIQSGNENEKHSID